MQAAGEKNFLTIMAKMARDGGAKADEYSEKFKRAVGVIFNEKNYVADFGNFKEGLFRSARTSCTTSGWLNCPPARAKNLDHLYTGIHAL